jgi:ribulose-phosphate 3-epimerase
VGVETIQKFPTNFHKEAHLMVSYPKQWIERLVKAEFERIIFHIECEDNIDEVIDLIKDKGLEVGLAIKIDTPLEKLDEFIHKIDMVLVMSIVSGFQGQPFIPKSLNRLKKIKMKGIRVGPDGAVNDDDIKEITETGADFVIVGSFLLKGNVDENLERLWETVNG